MIVVATEDFEIYHEVVNALRERGAAFTTQTPDEPLPEQATVVVTGPDEAFDDTVDVVRATPDDSRRAVDEALTLLRGSEGRTVVGVDPGDRPGIAVLSGDVVIAVFQVPVDRAAEVLHEEVAEAPDPVVRIGDGARLQGAKIIDDLPDLRVELVDETGTTPYLGSGARGMGDVVAAINIARIEGDVVEEREVSPSAGELQAIKDRSRERSEGNRTIDEMLARRVARGELTLDEALAEHREG